MVYGHDAVVGYLEATLPPVSVFIGPTSVGKHTTAEHLRDYYGVHAADYRYFPSLDAEALRAIVTSAALMPTDEFMLTVIEMDGSRVTIRDGLLAVLESASESHRYILLTSERLSPTLMSRAQRYTFPLLSQEAMEEVLRLVLSNVANVERLARASGGQVYRAFIASKQSAQRAQVIEALQSFDGRDAALLEGAAREWSEDHTRLLETWCQEAITGRWRVFEEDDAPFNDRKLAIRILIALRGGIRPRFVVRSRLMDIWKDYTS